MPASCTLDAREFGNKQDTSPPSFFKKKERIKINKNKTNIEKGRRVALADIWLAVRLWFKRGRGDLIPESCGEQSSCGSEHQARSGDFCDGAVCSHSWADSFISVRAELLWHEDTIAKYLQLEGYLKSMEVESHTDSWWATIALC